MERSELQKCAYAAITTLKRIELVSCGEHQIQADGDYGDADGLRWIYDEVKKFNKLWRDGNERLQMPCLR
jgi:hypothetical protein